MALSEKQIGPILQDVKDWAQTKVNAGAEPPWAWYQYMKLIEAANAILDGMGAVSRPKGNLRPVGSRWENDHRPKDSTVEPDKPPPRPSDDPVQLPM